MRCKTLLSYDLFYPIELIFHYFKQNQYNRNALSCTCGGKSKIRVVHIYWRIATLSFPTSNGNNNQSEIHPKILLPINRQIPTKIRHNSSGSRVLTYKRFVSEHLQTEFQQYIQTLLRNAIILTLAALNLLAHVIIVSRSC